MTVTVIPKPDGPFVYRTMSESLWDKGDVYMARGDAYFDEGKVSYAEGCWRKAEKKYKQAVKMENFLQPKSLLEEKVRDRLMAKIDAAIYGMVRRV